MTETKRQQQRNEFILFCSVVHAAMVRVDSKTL